MGRGTGKRQWAVFGDVDPTLTYPDNHPLKGEPVRLPVDPAEVEAKAADVANVVTMVGGTALMASEREISPLDGMWQTVAVYWEWHSYAPPAQGEPATRGKRGAQQQEAPARPPVAAEFQQFEGEPQEPAEEERDPDEFMPLSPKEQALLEREEAIT